MRKGIILAILALLSVSSVFLGLLMGSVKITCSNLIDTFLNGDQSFESRILMRVRFPRVLGAFFGGAALAMSGLLLQTFFRNPLAGPFVLGITSSAEFGVALYLLAGIPLGNYGIVSSAFLGSLLAMILILNLASKVRSPVVLLIAGLMLGYVFSALERILMTYAESIQAHQFVMWTFGSFSGITLSEVPVIISSLVPPMLISMFFLVKPLNALLLGEEYARSLGVNIRRTRIFLVLLACFLASIVTSFAGIVAFIGLAVPHLTRLLLKTSDHRILLPGTILTGSFVTVMCDTFARTAFVPTELPISVVTSLIGAPTVLFLLLKRRRLG
ncbi:iron ABC transporter permease [Nanoarchaeota archaeon]|nr:MAG: iron ABC transporter permease [Nanoarchaeota archaeon]